MYIHEKNTELYNFAALLNYLPPADIKNLT